MTNWSVKDKGKSLVNPVSRIRERDGKRGVGRERQRQRGGLLGDAQIPRILMSIWPPKLPVPPSARGETETESSTLWNFFALLPMSTGLDPDSACTMQGKTKSNTRMPQASPSTGHSRTDNISKETRYGVATHVS